MASPKLEIREKGEKRDNHINVNVYILKESTWWRNSHTTIRMAIILEEQTQKNTYITLD